jgi:hypothetical protein
MSGLVSHFLYALNELDPRDRRHAIWVVSPDVYEELDREHASSPFPPAELVEVGVTPPPERLARIFGIEVWVRYDLAPGTWLLDVDDPVTRAVKRARDRDPHGRHVTVNLMQAERVEFGPFPPAPEVTLGALVRKWIRKVRP